jgi:ABC-type cobalamin/Fe3+-siderophores transport system ATPase subunit
MSTLGKSPYELLGAHHLVVELGGAPILRDVTLRIGPGERVAIVGPNGAGKSTLLRALSGVLPATAGEVILCTEPIQRLPRETIARSIAVVTSEIELPFAMRLDEFVALGRIPHGRGAAGPTTHDRERAAAAIARVGASHLQGRDVRTLSAGERQLAAIALGLAQETPILALDEPTAHLDLRHRMEIADLLVSLAGDETIMKTKRTIIAIFHELDIVREGFTRAIILANGAIVADGTPSEVLTPDRISAAWGISVERAARR